MKSKISPDKIYQPSEDVVAREIQGEFILVPITSGIGDLEEDIFSLNKSGQAIWKKMDGEKSLKEIIRELAIEYSASGKEIENDCLGLTNELIKRKMIVETSR